MNFHGPLRYTYLLWLLSTSQVTAQGGCSGATSPYNQSGLEVTFKNLCGMDIQKTVDFPDATNEDTWAACLDRCVKKAPLCYGLDFRPLGAAQYNCWLMGGKFEESDGKNPGYTVDAAMLDPNLISRLPNDCLTLGLQGCFVKYGPLGGGAPSIRPSSTTTPRTSTQSNRVTPATIATTAITTNAGGDVVTVVSTLVMIISTAVSTASALPTSIPGGLSTGAKAGIGAGVGAIALIAIVIAAVYVLKRRKHRQVDGNVSTYVGENEKIVDDSPHRPGLPELQASRYGPYASRELAGSAPQEKTFAFAPQKQIHEIDGSTRYEK